MIEPLDAGVLSPDGFRAAGVACGLKAAGLDLALVACDRVASAAGLFTTNRAQAAPVILSRRHLQQSGGRARAIVINSGCANACTGDAGMTTALAMAEHTARAIGCTPEQVLVASTGVIGVALDREKVTRGIEAAARQVDRAHHDAVARAIMTTDPFPKESGARVETPRGPFRVGGMAKGAGMIEPMLATMLSVVTTDAVVAPAALQRALGEAVEQTFNAITVDGECSTNDSVLAMASGASGVEIDQAGYGDLVAGLTHVCRDLALAIVRGGEGATKLIRVRVTGAASAGDARQAARAIANSPLVKTAVHGGDPNWGRLVAVAGRAGVPFDLSAAGVRIGSTVLFEAGRPYDEHADEAARHLRNESVDIEVNLGAGGPGEATIWTCDLSAEYVKINADYRT